MDAYWQGLTMGLAYVAPIGVQNLFVIHTALSGRWKRSLLTALVVIFFDVTLALACFLGVGAALGRYERLAAAVLLGGGLVVVYIGWKLIGARAAAKTPPPLAPAKVVAAACAATWFNPQAIIDGTMMLGAFRVTLTEAAAGRFIAGVASASCLWFFGLTVLIMLCGRRVNDRVLRTINVVCGAVIIFYGIKLLAHFAAAYCL